MAAPHHGEETNYGKKCVREMEEGGRESERGRESGKEGWDESDK